MTMSYSVIVWWGSWPWWGRGVFPFPQTFGVFAGETPPPPTTANSLPPPPPPNRPPPPPPPPTTSIPPPPPPPPTPPPPQHRLYLCSPMSISVVGEHPAVRRLPDRPRSTRSQRLQIGCDLIPVVRHEYFAPRLQKV